MIMVCVRTWVGSPKDYIKFVEKYKSKQVYQVTSSLPPRLPGICGIYGMALTPRQIQVTAF
jgi:hypothetical protein